MPVARRPHQGIVAASAAAALALSACTSDVGARLDVEYAEAPPGDVVALPADFSHMLADAIDAAPEIVATVMEHQNVPGVAVAMVHADSVVFAEGFGVANLDTQHPVTVDTVFQIASMSKPLSATAIAAAFRDDPSLSWDTRLSTLTEHVTFADPDVTSQATIGDAFSHHLGLATGAGDDLEDMGFDKPAIIAALDDYPLAPFRAQYEYSNFGLTVGADAVAASRGQTWDELMDELIFEPLGMTSSSARHSDLAERSDRASLHTYIDGELSTDVDRNADAQAPAGGVSASASDLTSWMRMVLRGGTFEGAAIADEDALTTAMSAQVVRASTPPQWRAPLYGYGFNVDTLASGRTAVSHSGGFVSGAATNVQFVPSLDFAVVTLTNAPPTGAPEAINAAILDQLQFGSVTRDWPEVMAMATAELTAPVGDLVDTEPPPSPAPAGIEDVTGVYTSPHYGLLEITHDGALVAVLGPGGHTRLALEHWDGDTYAYEPRHENAPDGSRASATFSTGPGGKVEVTFSTFDANGLGTWVRL